MSEFDGFQLGVGDRELKFDSLVEGVHDFVFRRKEHLVSEQRYSKQLLWRNSQISILIYPLVVKKININISK